VCGSLVFIGNSTPQRRFSIAPAASLPIPRPTSEQIDCDFSPPSFSSSSSFFSLSLSFSISEPAAPGGAHLHTPVFFFPLFLTSLDSIELTRLQFIRGRIRLRFVGCFFFSFIHSFIHSFIQQEEIKNVNQFSVAQETPATPVSAAATERAKTTKTPTAKRTRRSAASSRKWPPTFCERGCSSI